MLCAAIFLYKWLNLLFYKNYIPKPSLRNYETKIWAFKYSSAEKKSACRSVERNAPKMSSLLEIRNNDKNLNLNRTPPCTSFCFNINFQISKIAFYVSLELKW